MANRRTLPFYGAVIAIFGLVAEVTVMLTAPPLTAFIVATAFVVSAAAVLRILGYLEAAVRRVDAYEQKGSDRG